MSSVASQELEQGIPEGEGAISALPRERDPTIAGPTSDSQSEVLANVRVVSATEALLADWRRQEQTLEREQFEATMLRRRLNADEIIEVLQRLRSAGVALESLESDADETVEGSDTSGISQDGFVRGYLKAPLLAHDDHVRLARAVQIGIIAQRDIDEGYSAPDLRQLVIEGERAKDKMVIANMRLVVSVARKLGGQGLELNDHTQNGMIGLMRAVELFDPDLGLKFSTYATWWIRQSIWRGNDNDSQLIRVPVHMIERIRKFRRTSRRLAAETGKEPSVDVIAEELDWPRDKVAFVHRLSLFRTTSLDAPIDAEGELHLGDILPSASLTPEQLTEIWSRDRLLKALVAGLAPREQLILERRFGLTSKVAETLQEIGDDLGITRERVRQIEQKALTKLYRKALKHMRALKD